MKAVEIFHKRIGEQNPVFIQLLGLCPLLAVSTKVSYALILGIASTVVVVIGSSLAAVFRRILQPCIRVPAYAITVACIVTQVEIGMTTFFPEWVSSIGLFIPLIVTNCAIFSRMEAFARFHSPKEAAIDGLSTGLGFLVALLIMGAIRQFFVEVLEFQMVLFPVGAFICLGLLIALGGVLRLRYANRTSSVDL